MARTIIDLQDAAAATLVKTLHLGPSKGRFARYAAQSRFEKGMIALGFDRMDKDRSIAKAWVDAYEMAELQYAVERDEARRVAKLERAA